MKKLFEPSQFTATAYDSAEDKAHFANYYVRFVESDFRDTMFNKKFYRRLSLSFGHIAHFDRDSFYNVWFSDTRHKLLFLQNAVSHVVYGDPKYTYGDVERELQTWIRGSGLIIKYHSQLDSEIEAAEREELARLSAKYGAS